MRTSKRLDEVGGSVHTRQCPEIFSVRIDWTNWEKNADSTSPSNP